MAASLQNVSLGLVSTSSFPTSGSQPIDRVESNIDPLAREVLSTPSSQFIPSDLSDRQIKKDPYLYEFPSSYAITLPNHQTVDLSGVKIKLHNIFRGGINWGGGSTELMAQAMESFGNPTGVFNLPFCIDAYINETRSIIQILSNKEYKLDDVRHLLSEKINEGITHFYLPIDMNSHASLAAFIVSDNSVSFRFYDSWKNQDFDRRYFKNKPFLDFLKSLLPSSLTINEKSMVLHPMDQGGEDSKGCGYYTVYTALLMTQKKELRDCLTFDTPLYDQTHDISIRAELVVRTLIAYGIDNVDCRWEAIIMGKRDGIFSRLEHDIKDLISQLRTKLQS